MITRGTRNFSSDLHEKNPSNNISALNAEIDLNLDASLLVEMQFEK